MQVITCIIHMFYVSNASIASNASNCLHYLHYFMQVMQVITHIICGIHVICMIQNFEYFELNHNPMRVLRGRLKLSISAMQVMQVFELRGGGFHSRLALRVYASFQISQIFFLYLTMIIIGLGLKR